LNNKSYIYYIFSVSNLVAIRLVYQLQTFITSNITTKITDRRWRRALVAKPASNKTGASELKRLAAVRVDRFVRRYRIHNSSRKLPRYPGDECNSDAESQKPKCAILQRQRCRFLVRCRTMCNNQPRNPKPDHQNCDEIESKCPLKWRRGSRQVHSIQNAERRESAGAPLFALRWMPWLALLHLLKKNMTNKTILKTNDAMLIVDIQFGTECGSIDLSILSRLSIASESNLPSASIFFRNIAALLRLVEDA